MEDKQSHDAADEKDGMISFEYDAKTTNIPQSARGINLDLSMAASRFAEEKVGEDFRQQEESVTVIFELPDGSQGESKFKLGQTVEFLKSFVESEYGILMQEQVLSIEGRVMLDPLSLLDYSEAKGNYSRTKFLSQDFLIRATDSLGSNEIFITVEGNLPRASKK
jgi:hypothetical protein